MCRFLAYLGKPIVLDKLLYQPKNSLVHQSYHAQEKKEPLNGDGFGVGFYVPELDPAPALFVSTTPAWGNRNLRYNAPKIRSHCIFAHVRAASYGEVAEMNCHPFQYNKLLFMHNGQIGGFKIVKRKLRQRLSDELYNWIQGTTDSEHFSEGSRFECDDGVCRMVQAGPAEHAVLVVSEKLTDAKEDWREAPKNHLVVVNENLSVALRPIKTP